MRELILTAAARQARNAASIARADTGAGRSRIQIYSAAGGVLLAARQLASPCAVLTADGRIQLQDGAQDELVQTGGAATWAAWCDGDGAPLYEGPVTDEAGQQSDGAGALVDSGDIGPWVLAGTHGTQLYAGGIVLLAAALIG